MFNQNKHQGSTFVYIANISSLYKVTTVLSFMEFLIMIGCLKVGSINIFGRTSINSQLVRFKVIQKVMKVHARLLSKKRLQILGVK